MKKGGMRENKNKTMHYMKVATTECWNSIGVDISTWKLST